MPDSTERHRDGGDGETQKTERQRRDTDGGDGETQKTNGQRRDRETQTVNVVSVLSQFADDNLAIVRNISTGLLIAGVVLIARSIKLTTTFKSASQIPARFFERHVSLRGKVHSVTEEGGVKVEHVPIHVPVLSTLLSHKRHAVSSSLLLVRLAGVEVTTEGTRWLQQNLVPAHTVWLKLISREDQVLHCLVSHSRGWMWSRCVNEQLLRLGLARTAPVSLLPDSRFYWRLHRRLHRSEVSAQRRGRGLWKEDSLWERVAKAVRGGLTRSVFRK